MSDSGESMSGSDTHLNISHTCRRKKGLDINDINSVCTFPDKKRPNLDVRNNKVINLSKTIPAKPVEIPMAASDGDGIGVMKMNCQSHGSISVIGRRRAMEDTVSVVPAVMGGAYDFFAVYDGHGGAKVAKCCMDRMHRLVAEEVEKVKFGGDEMTVSYWEKVMKRCFEKMDEEVARGVKAGNEGKLSEKTLGATALVVLLGKEVVVAANCGDCRAVLCHGGGAVALSSDHKPDRADERKRIEAAGGEVIDWNGSRVLGVLDTSRSVGDQYLKPYVTSEPEVTVTERKESDEFIVIATDGLWDVISNELACEVVKCFCGQSKNKRLSEEFKGRNAAEAAAVLAEFAIAKGSNDNISVIIVELTSSQ